MVRAWLEYTDPAVSGFYKRVTIMINSGIMERPTKWLLSAFLVLATVICAAAEYTDVIDTPSLKIKASRTALAVNIARAGSRLLSVGERGHILFSDDMGNTWTQSDVETSVMLNAVFFVNEKKGWAAGEDAVIVHTEDGGLTWKHQFDGRDAANKGPLLDIVFTSETTGFAVGVYNKIFKTADGGKTWINWREHVDNPDEWHLFKLSVTVSGNMYIGSEQGLVFKSEDNGDTFSPIQTDHIGSFHGLLARTGADGADQILAFGPGGALWAGRNGGESWKRLETNTRAGLMAGAWLADKSAIIVGHEGMILRINASLTKADHHSDESGLPLSGVLPVSAEKLVIVSFGGPKVIGAPPAD